MFMYVCISLKLRLDPWGRLLTKKRVGETVYFTKREDRMSKGTKGKCGLCSRNNECVV